MGKGEGDEWSEEPSDELGDLREQIGRLYKEPSHEDQDQPETGQGDRPSDEDQHGAEGPPEVAEPSTRTSEETEPVEQEAVETEIDPHKSEFKDEEDGELEQLREQVRERYEKTAEDANGDIAQHSDEVDERATPLPEASQEDAVEGSPQGEAQSTEQGNQESHEPLKENDESTTTESMIGSPGDEPQSPHEEEEGPRLPEHDEGTDYTAAESGSDSVREPTADEVKIEESESPDKLDADAPDLAHAEGTRQKADQEESTSETTSEADPSCRNPVEVADASGPTRAEELEGRSPAKPDNDEDRAETPIAETPDEPDSEASVLRESQIGSHESNAETRDGSRSGSQTTENPSEFGSEAEEPNKVLTEATRTLAKEYANEDHKGDVKESQPPSITGEVHDTGEDERTSKLVQSGHSGGEDSVSSGAFETNWVSWRPQDMSQEPIERNSDPNAILVETSGQIAAVDGGGHRPESPELSMGPSNLRIDSGDSDKRRDFLQNVAPRDAPGSDELDGESRIANRIKVSPPDLPPNPSNSESDAPRKETSDSYGSPQTRGASQESQNLNPRQATDEGSKISSPADHGTNQSEVAKGQAGKVDSTVASEDSGIRQIPQAVSEQPTLAEGKSVQAGESQPEVPSKKASKEVFKGTDEHDGSAQTASADQRNAKSAATLSKEAGDQAADPRTSKPDKNSGNPFVGTYQQPENNVRLKRQQSGVDATQNAPSHPQEKAKDYPEAASLARHKENISDRGQGEATNMKGARAEQGIRETKPAEPRSDFTIAQEASSLRRGGITSQHGESKNPLFIAHEWKVGESNYLRIPRRYLATHGKEDILEARVVRASVPDKEYHVFTYSGFADPHVNIFHLKPSRRETFHVLSLEKYDFSGFSRDFNKLRPKEFRNVNLYCSNERVTMRVDNNLVELKHPRLFSDGGGVVLEANLNEKKNGGAIRITRLFDDIDLHLKDYPTNHPRILFMKAVGSKIEVGHRVSQYAPDHRTRMIESSPLDNRDLTGERIERNRLLKLDSSPMSKKEIRAWIDTEGCLYVPHLGSSSSPRLDCSQKRREPLEAYVRGVEELTGVVPVIRKESKRDQHVAVIDDIEGIAKVVSAVGPFRAPQKVDEVRRFMKFLTREREGTGRRRVIERAKRRLGL